MIPLDFLLKLIPQKGISPCAWSIKWTPLKTPMRRPNQFCIVMHLFQAHLESSQQNIGAILMNLSLVFKASFPDRQRSLNS